MSRYAPACEGLFVIFPKSQRLGGKNILVTISRCIADIN